jgi:hypothetical protein
MVDFAIPQEACAMTDENRSKVTERVDEEFAGRHGTTLAGSSIDEEKHPEMHPQGPGELADKVRAEAAEGHGVVDKVKRGLQEMDRDIAGEYERREDPTAPPPKP